MCELSNEEDVFLLKMEGLDEVLKGCLTDFSEEKTQSEQDKRALEIASQYITDATKEGHLR